MPEYPNNSHSAKENAGKPEKKMEKVVTGAAKTRKKSEVRKFAGVFAPEDAASVKNYILTDVVVPGIKNAIADVVSIVLFGEAGRIGGRKRNGSNALLRIDSAETVAVHGFQRYCGPLIHKKHTNVLLQSLENTVKLVRDFLHGRDVVFKPPRIDSIKNRPDFLTRVGQGIFNPRRENRI